MEPKKTPETGLPKSSIARKAVGLEKKVRKGWDNLPLIQLVVRFRNTWKEWWEYQDLELGLKLIVKNFDFSTREVADRAKRQQRWKERARVLIRQHLESYLQQDLRWSPQMFLHDIYTASGQRASDIVEIVELLDEADQEFGKLDKFSMEDLVRSYQQALEFRNPAPRILVWRQRAYALAEEHYDLCKSQGREWSPTLFLGEAARATGANPSLIRELREDVDQLVIDRDIDITSDEFFTSRGWVRPTKPRTWLQKKYLWYLIVDGLMQAGYIVNGEKTLWGENIIDKEGKPMRRSGSQDVDDTKDNEDLPDWLKLLRKQGR